MPSSTRGGAVISQPRRCRRRRGRSRSARSSGACRTRWSRGTRGTGGAGLLSQRRITAFEHDGNVDSLALDVVRVFWPQVAPSRLLAVPPGGVDEASGPDLAEPASGRQYAGDQLVGTFALDAVALESIAKLLGLDAGVEVIPRLDTLGDSVRAPHLGRPYGRLGVCRALGLGVGGKREASEGEHESGETGDSGHEAPLPRRAIGVGSEKTYSFLLTWNLR